MNNELVTVFGASGFLGRHTVRALARSGYRIRAAMRHPHLAHFLPPMGNVGQIQLLKTNVREPEQVAAALEGASAAVNLTGILFQSGEQKFDAIHVEAAGAIAAAARDAGLRALVHVSAIGADVKSESRYAKTKGEGEQRVREAFPGAVILRPSVVFGPEDEFFNKFAGLARLLPALPLIGGGQTKFQPVFVADVAAAITRCLEDAATAGNTYELGGPIVYSFKELMQIVLKETDRKRPLLPLPFALASLQAMVLQFLPFPRKPLLTPDQVELLKHDNVVAPDALTLADLGIVPDAVEAVVPNYLWRFRPRGQFDRPSTASAGPQ